MGVRDVNVKQIRRTSLIALLVLMIALLTAGFANAQGGTTKATITETEFKLDPAQVTVPINTPVQFTIKNAGKVDHNIKFELPSAGIEQTLFATDLKPGESRTGTFTFTKPGSWEMYCPVGNHEDLGMKGVALVLAAQGAAPATLPKTGSPEEPLLLALAGLSFVSLTIGRRLARQTARR